MRANPEDETLSDPKYTRLVQAAKASGVPENRRSACARYVLYHIFPGGFLSAVISNDLRESIRRSDDSDRNCLLAYVRFFYNHAPADCWGSLEKFNAWMRGEQS